MRQNPPDAEEASAGFSTDSLICALSYSDVKIGHGEGIWVQSDTRSKARGAATYYIKPKHAVKIAWGRETYRERWSGKSESRPNDCHG